MYLLSVFSLHYKPIFLILFSGPNAWNRVGIKGKFVEDTNDLLYLSKMRREMKIYGGFI